MYRCKLASVEVVLISYRRNLNGKNNFAVFKNLDTDLKIILLNYQNYIGRSSIIDNAKSFVILATSLSILRNYFYVLTKLFSDLYSAKF